MSNTLQRIVSIFLYVLFAISLVFIIWFYFGNNVPGTEGTNYVEPVATNSILIWAYILLGIAAATTLVFSLIYLIAHPKNAIRALIVLVVIAVIVGISYAISSDVPLRMEGYQGSDNVPEKVKWVGTGLNVAYILGGTAFLGMIFSEIYRVFK